MGLLGGKNRLGDARSGGFGVFWRWEMKIFGDFFCVFAIFHSFFCKNDEKLAYVFGVRACLIDFCSGGFYFGFG